MTFFWNDITQLKEDVANLAVILQAILESNETIIYHSKRDSELLNRLYTKSLTSPSFSDSHISEAKLLARIDELFLKLGTIEENVDQIKENQIQESNSILSDYRHECQVDTIQRFHEKLNILLADDRIKLSNIENLKMVEKFEDYMKNIDKINSMINEFKGCVAMARASLHDMKQINHVIDSAVKQAVEKVMKETQDRHDMIFEAQKKFYETMFDHMKKENIVKKKSSEPKRLKKIKAKKSTQA